MIIFSERGHLVFVDPVLLKEEICRAKEEENCPYMSMAATKPSK